MAKIEATTLLATCEALTRKSWDERNEIEPNPDVSGPGVRVDNRTVRWQGVTDMTSFLRFLLDFSALWEW